ncbi:peptidylprolyl isomerase [Granulicella tundricola]|uniref:Peptidyl-prolyl cis-trans isomerase n=1 Tax=Granulicella tundricola (strain ATCC BAA-1859 / DSM 23138 / MP5ACTX9) TaxID=1198114 RepID=E8WVI9_GRATM|nr:peptidylprolyl isomerase [Granulicella tundricola]ADW68437.1 Peptidylprolyl isomerase [Granulicella tundricola MP5ACTX9]
MIFRTGTTTCFAALLFSSALMAQTPAKPAEPLPDSPTPQAAQPASQLPDAPGAGQGAPAPSPTGPTVIMDTNMGRLTCKFFDKQSPLATENFISLAEGKKDWTDPKTLKKIHGVRFYDGTTFHRVIPGFMIQGGDHAGDGTGDAGYFFDNETTPGLYFDVPGRLAMANAGPNTNGTQFFITELPQPDLDGKYTIFGQCDAHSVLIVATIARVDRNNQDKPITPVLLNKVTIVKEGQAIPAEPVPPAASPAGPGVPVMPPPPK